MRRFVLPLLLLVPAVASAEEGAEPVEQTAAATRTYRIDPAASALWVTVFNDTSTMASRLGHDHAIAATDYQATIVWNVDDPGACRVSFDLPVDELWPDPPGFRERAGLDPDGAVGESAKNKIKSNFLGKSQLDGARHPTITYRSTRCSGTRGAVQVTGDLTIRGVTKRLTVPMQVTVTDDTFAAKGTFELTHGDFGFDPFTNLGGALRNLPKLVFGIDVKGEAVE